MGEITVAVVSPGAMGAAVGARLAANGVRVITPKGRSSGSLKRAADAGLTVCDEAALADVDFVFSIVPPAVALETALRVAPFAGSAGGRRPLFVDWNAVSFGRVREIEAAIVGAGGRFADGCIIGAPPTKEGAGPILYASGAEAAALSSLAGTGLRFEVMDAGIGAASALKMSYAGITKGLVALGAAMFLAAERAGSAELLLAELARSQPHILTSFRKSLPDMVPKARRWAPELEEVAAFIGPERTESAVYRAIAAFYGELADASDADAPDVQTLLEMAAAE